MCEAPSMSRKIKQLYRKDKMSFAKTIETDRTNLQPFDLESKAPPLSHRIFSYEEDIGKFMYIVMHYVLLNLY